MTDETELVERVARIIGGEVWTAHPNGCMFGAFEAMETSNSVISAIRPGDRLPGGMVVEHDWQPIDTAPTDRLIDIWAHDMRFMDCYWVPICKEYRTTGSAGVLQRIGKPTHWKPTSKPMIDAAEE